MICTCPKCSAQIEADEPSNPEKGGMTRCPECNSRFWAQRESFLLRAYRKDWQIYCSNCGTEVGPDIFCRGCSLTYPDYWMVHASKLSVRYPYQPALSLDLSFGGARRRKPGSYSYSEGGGEEPNRKPLYVFVALLALVIALIVGGGYMLLGSKTDKKFSENYVVALYGVKSGADMSVKKVEQAAAKGGLSSQELADLDTVKAEIDAALQKVATAPPEYAAAADKLNQLYTIYGRLYTLSKTSASVAEAKQLEAQFNQAALEVKQILPADLAEQLRKDSSKYRNLQFLVQ